MPERPEYAELSARPELPRLHFPSIRLRARERDGQVEVWDALRGAYLVLTPEEWVRQHLIAYLISHCEALPLRKAPDVPVDRSVFRQAVRYNSVLSARYVVLTNGLTHYCCEFCDGKYVPLSSFPRLSRI